MTTMRNPDVRPVRKAHPTGEKFDPPVALEQAKALYPKVMAKLAD